MDNSSEAQIFNGFICRVAGLPVNYVTDLRSSLLASTFKLLSDKEIEISKLIEKLSDFLYKDISNTTEQSIKNKLIQLRRDVYNRRTKKYSDMENFISTDTNSTFQKYHILNTEKEKLVKNYQECFTLELERIRKEFKLKIRNDDFQKGLLISSKSLFSSQKIYQRSDNINLNRKQEQVERGLLRYFTRMVMKATPFGAFCSIIPGQIYDNGTNESFYFTGNPHEKKSLVIINKGLYGNILKHLLTIKGVRQKLKVELNQTMESQGDAFHYLTAIDGKEIFQRLTKNPVLDFIIGIFSRESTIQYFELVTLLSSDTEIDATIDEITQYLDKLLEIGLLRFKIGIPEQQVEWVEELCSILDDVDNKDVKETVKFLKNIEAKIKNYVHEDVYTRSLEIGKINELVKNFYEKIELKLELIADLYFYEDATSNSSFVISENHINTVSECLIKFINLTNHLAYPRTEQVSIRHFYDEYYKNKKEEISLLRFYEDYYREHFKEHLEKLRNAKNKSVKEESKDYNLSNPYNLQIITDIQNAHNSLHNLIIKKWQEDLTAEEINFSSNDIRKTIENIDEISETSISASVFAQTILASKKAANIRLIVDGGKYLLGYGKYFSRFLRLFGQDIQQNLYKTNNSLSDEIIAEISGDANFNANLHPPLLKNEISYPTSEVGMAEVQIKCTDIVVEPDENNLYALRLKHKISNRFILPVDLGFLNHMMRPPLFQLLSKFSPPSGFSILLPEYPKERQNKYLKNQTVLKSKFKSNGNALVNNTANAGLNDTTKGELLQVIYRPRIVFENSIIISRKAWIVPYKLFPSLQNEESAADYFVRINKWRIENNIPEQVYVKVKPLPVPNNSTGNNNDKEATSEQEMVEQIPEVKTGKSNGDADSPGTNTQIKPEEKAANKNYTKVSRDYYKPQFIDFYNPLLVNLFGKLVVNLKNFKVTIEERYPSSSQLPKYNGLEYSTEQIFQVNFPAKVDKVLEKQTREYANE